MSSSVLFKKKHIYTIEDQNHIFTVDFDIRQKKENMEYQHSHPYYEIFFFIEGECDHIIEGKRYKLKPYDFVLLKKYQLHKSTYLKAVNKRLILGFNRDFLSPAFDSQLNWILSAFEEKVPIFRYNKSERENIFNNINELYSYIYKNDPAQDIMLSNTLLRLVHNIKKYSPDNVYEETIYDNKSIMYKMQEVASYIHNNFHDELTLTNLSNKFFVSSPYLSHKFKEYSNFSLTDYIQLTRIRRAQELLIETNHKIINICELCGFGSISQFNRIFVKNCGLSPSQYRINSKITKSNMHEF